MIKHNAHISEPDSVEVTISITMKLSDWDRLRDQIEEKDSSDRYPTQKVIYIIKSAIGKVKKEVFGTDELEEAS